MVISHLSFVISLSTNNFGQITLDKGQMTNDKEQK